MYNLATLSKKIEYKLPQCPCLELFKKHINCNIIKYTAERRVMRNDGIEPKMLQLMSDALNLWIT